jgi:hypothetical protein
MKLTIAMLVVAAMAGPAAALRPGTAPSGSPRTADQQPAAVAASMTGTWILNKALSPGLANPGRGREGRSGGLLSVTLVPAAFQRGGGRGGGGGGAPGIDMPEPMAEERAAQAALAVIQQVPFQLTIEATPAEIAFLEPRGRLVYKIDGKTASMEVPGGVIKVKCRWDRATLRQEFSSTRQTLRRSWSIDADNRLVLVQHIESLTFNSKDAKAVFDRQ